MSTASRLEASPGEPFRLVEIDRKEQLRRREEEAELRATSAVSLLQQRAQHDGPRVLLDVDVLLGGLLSTRAKYIAFRTLDSEVVVPRVRLSRLKRLKRRLPHLHAWLSADALCVRWRDGRGGLNLHCLPPAARRPSDILIVPLDPAPCRPALPFWRAVTAQLLPMTHLG